MFVHRVPSNCSIILNGTKGMVEIGPCPVKINVTVPTGERLDKLDTSHESPHNKKFHTRLLPLVNHFLSVFQPHKTLHKPAVFGFIYNTKIHWKVGRIFSVIALNNFHSIFHNT